MAARAGWFSWPRPGADDKFAVAFPDKKSVVAFSDCYAVLRSLKGNESSRPWRDREGAPASPCLLRRPFCARGGSRNRVVAWPTFLRLDFKAAVFNPVHWLAGESTINSFNGELSNE